MFNPSTPPQTVHMILAAFMVAGFLVASVYAAGLLRGERDRYHMLGFLLPFTMAAVVTPVQIVVGDWAARLVANEQPVKLAAMEGVFDTGAGVPLHVGGIAIDGQLRYAIEIPKGLSLLAHLNPNATIEGLNEVPTDQWPPVNIVHWAFDIMVGIGVALLALSAWLAVTWWRRRAPPVTPWFWRAAVVAGPATVVALEAGWVLTEVGRQPWIVYGIMRTADAVNPAPGLRYGLYLLLIVYAVLTVASVLVLRWLAREPLPAPQERTPEAAAAEEGPAL
jgi:cytochrome bd ubiquinol oxidase subunit I